MGDINAHINCNETDLIINDSDNVLDSFLPKNYIADSMQVLRNTQIPQTTNLYLKYVPVVELRILNSRTIGDSVGKVTYHNYNGTTINDYYICSASFLNNILNFQVGYFSPTMSDHCPITVNCFHKLKRLQSILH